MISQTTDCAERTMYFETCRRAHLSPRLIGVPSCVAWRAVQAEESEEVGEDVREDETQLRQLSVVLVEDVVVRANAGEAARKEEGRNQSRLPPEAPSCGITRKLQLSTEGFWEFLFSDRWPENALLRVLEGELLNSLLVALYRLERHHDVVSYVTLAKIDNERLIKPCSKTAVPREQRICSKEMVLVELDYWCPQRRVECSSSDTRRPAACTEDAVNTWSPLTSEVSQPKPKGETDAAQSEDIVGEAQDRDTSWSVHCSIRGMTRPLPHTDCSMPYHMIREPFLMRQQRESRMFPSLQLPQSPPESFLSQCVDESQKKLKEEKLSKEDMMQLGPHLEDGTEMLAPDPFLEPLPPELCAMLSVFSSGAGGNPSPKLKATGIPSATGVAKKDQKKPGKKDAYESDTLTDEEADQKKCTSWVDLQREERIEGDLRLMRSDLHVRRSDIRRKWVSMKSRLRRQLRERQRERSRRSDILPSDSPGPSPVPLRNYNSSETPDSQCTKINRWTKCPTFAEFYSWMLEHPANSRESGTPPDKRKGKKGKSTSPDSGAQKSSPRSEANEGAKEGKGKKEKDKHELNENVKDGQKDKATGQGQGEEVGQRGPGLEDKEGQHVDKQSRKAEDEHKEKTDKDKSDSKEKNKMTRYKDKDGQQEGSRGRRDFQEKRSQQVGKRKQHGKAEYTLHRMHPVDLTKDRVRERARLGITPSGTQLLTPEQVHLIQDAGLIISDEDPWHISIRFAYLAGGVCDCIAVCNSLLSRRARILRLIEEAKLIYKLNESRLWDLVRVVPAEELCGQKVNETEGEESTQSRTLQVLQHLDTPTCKSAVTEVKPMWKWVGKYQPERRVKTKHRAGSPLDKIWPGSHKQHRKEPQSPRSPKIETTKSLAKSGKERDAFKREAAGLSCERYWVKKGAAITDKCAGQGKNVATHTTENISFQHPAKNDRAFLSGTIGKVAKDKKSVRGRSHIQTGSEKDAQQTSIPDLDNLTEAQLFELMNLNKIFDPTKLKSSYSFEKIFAGHQDRFPNYNKLLSEFQKPFKGKDSKDKKDKSDKTKKDKNEKIASLVVQETLLESSVVAKEIPTEVLPSEPMVIGKLRKFNFLKYRDYVSGTANIGQPPCNVPTLEEMCMMLERAMQIFVVRKERATTTQQFQSKVSVTFTRRQPPDASGAYLVANTSSIVSNTCNTLNFSLKT